MHEVPRLCDVDAELAMDAGALDAQKYANVDRSPFWIIHFAVRAHIVAREFG